MRPPGCARLPQCRSLPDACWEAQPELHVAAARRLCRRAADAASAAAWEALTSLRTNLTDRGHGPAPPASAALFDHIHKQIVLDVETLGIVEASDRRSAVHLHLMTNKHLLQLIDRALSGRLEATDQDYDPAYKPSLLYNLIKTEFTTTLEQLTIEQLMDNFAQDPPTRTRAPTN